MKRFFTFLFIFSSIALSAQISILRSDYGYIGDVVRFNIDTPAQSSLNSTILSTGANKTWNFTTGLIGTKFDSLIYSAAGTGTPTGTNLVVTNSNSTQFQNVDTNFVRLILDQPAYNVTGLSLKIFKFPFTSGSLLRDSMIYFKKGTPADFNLGVLTTFGFDSVIADIKAYDSVACTGWGTINLPDTGGSVIQVKVTEITNINFMGHSVATGWMLINSLAGIPVHQKNVEFQWIGKNSKGYLARAVMDTNGLLVQSFTYRVKKVILPVIKSVTPASAQRGQIINITINAANTHFTQSTGFVASLVNGTSSLIVNSVAVASDTTLTASVTITQTNTTGLYNLTVVDPIYGNINLANAFQVNASAILPTLKTVSPNSGSLKQTLNIVIAGSATHFTQSTSSIIVSFIISGNPSTKISVNSKTAINDSILTCSITIDSTAANGLYIVQVTDLLDGTISLANSFSVVTTGINSVQDNSVSLNVFPNPANNELNFVLNNSLSEISIQISDITGRCLKLSNISNNQTAIDISDLNNGIYFISVSGKEFTSTKKIIISK